MKPKSYEDYKNKDKRCKYPFEPCGVGYCWGYASLFDESKNMEELKEKLKTYCIKCEFYKK